MARFFFNVIPALIFSVWALAGGVPGWGAEAAAEPDRSGGENPVETRRREAARIASSLDDRLLAAQVMMSGVDGKGTLDEDMKTLFAECPPGGIMFFRYNLDTEPRETKAFLREWAAFVAVTGAGGRGVPPFMAVDHEGGDVHRFGPGITRLPAAGSYWELAEARGWDEALASLEDAAFRSAMEIRDLGITLNFAPLAETLTNENRPFLEGRSYGPDPRFVEKAAGAFIRGMGRAGIGAVAKHFPGSTGADPHVSASALAGDRETLAVMVRPFTALIAAGMVPAVMVSHNRVPAWDAENNASLSAAVMETWLRGELGFTGIIIADDFSMAAAAASGLTAEAAAIKSLAAGADMVMAWPGNIRRMYQAILAAVQRGDLPRERLREAAERILFEKIRLGIIDGE
ncbi:MAG: glycoside hydrolase family 3 protein [Treponema sp.]|jgi:beta-N-acetylhexosaminidase|nr:glycoside hydrolase family 3 protein [Treponema sp.]